MDYPTKAVAVDAPGLLRRSIPYARVATQLAVAALLLGGLLWRVDLGAVRDELEAANPWWLPLAFAANLVSDWFRAIRWQQFFAPMKRLSLPFLFLIAVVGVATNLALPLRAGEVLRVQLLRRRTGLSAASVVATILSEKLTDIVAFSTFIVLGLVLYRQARFLWPLALVYGVVLLLGLLGARWLAGRASRPLWLAVQPEGLLRARIARELDAFAQGLQAFRRPGAIFTVVWASHLAWLCEALMYYACGRSLGLDLSPAVYLLVVVAATIAVSVPVTQAGLGVFELAIAGLLVAFGVDANRAAAFSIFSHVMLALPYFASGPLAAFALRLTPRDVLFLGRPAADRSTPTEDAPIDCAAP